MKRDFSETQKQNLLNMVKEVQPDGFFEGIGDWFGDRGLGIKKFFGGLDIYKYLNDMDNYHRQMIDKDNVSATKINKIFTDAINVDTDYKTTFSGNCALINDFSALVKEFYSCIFLNNPTFCSVDSINEINQSKLYSGYKKKYIDNFEAAYPEHKKNMNKFLKPMEKEYQTDVENIKFIVYSSEEPYRSLFLDNVDGVSLVYTNDGSSYGSKKINYNWKNPEKKMKDERGPYAGFFHEYGHYLDDKYGKSKYYSREYKSSNGTALEDVISNDVINRVRNEVNAYLSENDIHDDKLANDITNRIVYGNVPNKPDDYTENVSADTIEKSKIVQQRLKKQIDSASASGVSDSFDGITNYTSTSRSSGKGISGDWGHGDEYWYKNNKKTDNYACEESFATYFSVKLRNDSESLSYYQKYLPNATEQYDNMINDMSDR